MSGLARSEYLRKGVDKGLLIVSAKTESDLPSVFVKEFEVVKLEPVGFEVQDKSPIAQEINKLFYDDAKAFLFLETGNPCKLTGDEQTLVDFLKDGKQHVNKIMALRVLVWVILYFFEHTSKDFQSEILLVT